MNVERLEQQLRVRLRIYQEADDHLRESALAYLKKAYFIYRTLTAPK